MHRYRHMMVGLTRTEADAELIRYAAMVAALGTVNALRFVHVMQDSTTEDHDRVCDELLAVVRPIFASVPSSVPLSCDVLHGPLVDRFLGHIAEKQADVL